MRFFWVSSVKNGVNIFTFAYAWPWKDYFFATFLKQCSLQIRNQHFGLVQVWCWPEQTVGLWKMSRSDFRKWKRSSKLELKSLKYFRFNFFFWENGSSDWTCPFLRPEMREGKPWAWFCKRGRDKQILWWEICKSNIMVWTLSQTSMSCKIVTM